MKFFVLVMTVFSIWATSSNAMAAEEDTAQRTALINQIRTLTRTKVVGERFVTLTLSTSPYATIPGFMEKFKAAKPAIFEDLANDAEMHFVQIFKAMNVSELKTSVEYWSSSAGQKYISGSLDNPDGVRTLSMQMAAKLDKAAKEFKATLDKK